MMMVGDAHASRASKSARWKKGALGHRDGICRNGWEFCQPEIWGGRAVRAGWELYCRTIVASESKGCHDDHVVYTCAWV